MQCLLFFPPPKTALLIIVIHKVARTFLGGREGGRERGRERERVAPSRVNLFERAGENTLGVKYSAWDSHFKKTVTTT